MGRCGVARQKQTLLAEERGIVGRRAFGVLRPDSHSPIVLSIVPWPTTCFSGSRLGEVSARLTRTQPVVARNATKHMAGASNLQREAYDIRKRAVDQPPRPRADFHRRDGQRALVVRPLPVHPSNPACPEWISPAKSSRGSDRSVGSLLADNLRPLPLHLPTNLPLQHKRRRSCSFSCLYLYAPNAPQSRTTLKNSGRLLLVHITHE